MMRGRWTRKNVTSQGRSQNFEEGVLKRGGIRELEAMPINNDVIIAFST